MIGYAGLAYFLVLVPAFGLAGVASASASTFLPARARRLLLPWVIWSAIYAALKLGLMAIERRHVGNLFAPFMIVTGTSLHLWFLPYAFVASLCLPPVRQLAIGLRRPAFLLLMAAILLASLMSFLPALHHQPDPPWAQWAYGLPSLVAGLALGLAWLRRENARLVSLFLLAVTAIAWLVGWRDGVLQLVVAVSAILACLVWPSPTTRFSAFCTRHSMGVYLVHPLCVSALVRTMPLDRHGLPIALLAMAASLGLSVFLGMFRSSRILIGDMPDPESTVINRRSQREGAPFL